MVLKLVVFFLVMFSPVFHTVFFNYFSRTG